MEALTLLFLAWLLGGSKRNGAKPAPLAQTITATAKPAEPAAAAALPAAALPALPAPGVTVFGTAWKKRCTDLARRGKSGARWIPLLASRLGESNADAASRWVGMESGGNPYTVSSMGERGLAQGLPGNYSAADWTALKDKSTSDAMHAAIAARQIMRCFKGTTPDAFVDQGTIGLAKLYHALPLLVKELRTQGLLKGNVIETLAAMLGAYKPSAKTASYVKGKYAVTGDVLQDIALRFFGPAAVIAYGDASAGVLDSLAAAGARR